VPELAILPQQIFEVRESEAGANFSYALSLTSEPTKEVAVRVQLEIRTDADCDRVQQQRLLLLTPFLVWSPENYSVAQFVHARVQKDSTYQGILRASFVHTVETEDPNWNTALLRAVSLTLQDDDPCPSGAGQFEGADSVRKCQCLEGHFIARRDPLFCESAVECTLCVPGLVCDTLNQELENTIVETGMCVPPPLPYFLPSFLTPPSLFPSFLP
jgi:hypothetical protein